VAGKSPAAKARIRTYDVWREMWKRCTYPTNKSFKNYGGRGIRVCAEWASFRAFLADMGVKPDGYSIDRQDVDGHYEPRNCKWIPVEHQSASRRISKRAQAAVPAVLDLRAAGKSQDEISAATGIHQTTVCRILAANNMRTRINNGRSWVSAGGSA
jgi:hypothetical protein